MVAQMSVQVEPPLARYWSLIDASPEPASAAVAGDRLGAGEHGARVGERGRRRDVVDPAAGDGGGARVAGRVRGHRADVAQAVGHGRRVERARVRRDRGRAGIGPAAPAGGRGLELHARDAAVGRRGGGQRDRAAQVGPRVGQGDRHGVEVGGRTEGRAGVGGGGDERRAGCAGAQRDQRREGEQDQRGPLHAGTPAGLESRHSPARLESAISSAGRPTTSIRTWRSDSAAMTKPT